MLEIELGKVQQRVLETAKGQFLFRVTDAGRDFLLREGTDQRYGARHLKRAIERHVVYPLANLLATEQVHARRPGAHRLGWRAQSADLCARGRRRAGQQCASAKVEAAAAAAEVRDGKTVDAPTEAVAEAEKIARGVAGGDSRGGATGPQEARPLTLMHKLTS